MLSSERAYQKVLGQPRISNKLPYLGIQKGKFYLRILYYYWTRRCQSILFFLRQAFIFIKNCFLCPNNTEFCKVENQITNSASTLICLRFRSQIGRNSNGHIRGLLCATAQLLSGRLQMDSDWIPYNR